MKCREARLDFTGYLDHSLDSATAIKLQEHLAQCRECSDELRFLKAYREKIAVLPQEKAPADFYSNVMARIDTEATQGFWTRLLKGRTRLVHQIAGVMAVFLVFFVALRIHETTLQQVRQPIPGKSFKQNIASDQASEMKPSMVAVPEKEKPTNPPAQYRNSVGGGIKKSVAIQTPDGEGTPVRAENNSAAKETAKYVRDAQTQPLSEAAEQTPGSATRNQPAVAPIAAFDAGMRIVKLVIEPGNITEQMKADAAPMLKKREFASKSGYGVTNEKTEGQPSATAAPTATFSLETLLEKYHIRVIAREDEPTKQVQTRVLEIPGSAYQDFMTELAKIGQLEETPQTDITKGNVSGEEELRLRLTPRN